MTEYYVMTVKVATGANKYLVVSLNDDSMLVVHDKWDEELGARALAEYLNRG